MFRRTNIGFRKEGAVARRSIAEIRKEEILEAFYTVVAEKGFTKASIREIAKHAGCSYRMLLHYFKSKEEIVLAAQEQLMSVYGTDLRPGLLDKSKSATDRLNFMFSYFSDLERFSLDFCRAWVEFWALTKVHPSISRGMQKVYEDIKTLIEDIIRDGIKTGEFRKVNPEITTNLILATSEGLTMLWSVNTENTPVETVNDHISEFCLSYLKKGN